MSKTSVLYVQRRDAKMIKSHLEDNSQLDKRFRMVPTNSDAIIQGSQRGNGEETMSQVISGQCIAVPVTQTCITNLDEYSWAERVVGTGLHYCPFSTSMGNSNRESSAEAYSSNAAPSSQSFKSLNDVQHALVEALISCCLRTDASSEVTDLHQSIITSVLSLSALTCPKKLEVMGDDRTLVVPRWSFYLPQNNDYEAILDTRKGADEFHQLLFRYKVQNGEQQFQSKLWETLSRTHRSPRVVRRGDIDPESGVRESGHRILWPRPGHSAGDFNRGFILSTTGKDSPGWITVTEHKISQSFDLTKVMFSRGNVTEKKRFASLVQEGECVLDMYAGIGYYTLPALIHGKAKTVTACEWNPNAIYALKHNLQANGVEDRVTVLEGDCRESLRALFDSGDVTDTIKQFDRVSLGLLPSSEGGWDIAIASLNQTTGGWLHIHGNVPTAERNLWSHWVCQSLFFLTKKHLYSKDWNAICVHVERVKSFAPLVDHLVADVFVGPTNSPKLSLKYSVGSTGVIDSSGQFHQTDVGEVISPSCALGKDGILHQDWLK